jgi:hypothetical protein
VAQAAVVLEELIQLLLAQLTQVAAVVELGTGQPELTVVLALSLFPTLAHNVVLAAQLHQAVATLFTHLLQAVHLQLN